MALQLLLLLLPQAMAGPPSSVLLVAAGENQVTVEAWLPGGITCSLPPLPGNREYLSGSSLDWVGGRVVSCQGQSCLCLGPAGWEEVQWTRHGRVMHSSAVTARGLLLLGGYDSPATTELATLDGGEGVESFPLQPERDEHCLIRVADSTIVLTGGRTTFGLVQELSGLDSGGWEVVARELPSLLTGRRQHSCGGYTNGAGAFTLLVTGGIDAYSKALASTELLVHGDDGGAWREAGPLPSVRYAARAAALGPVLHLLGGYDPTRWTNQTLDEVVAWDPVAEGWDMAETNLTAVRTQHAAAEVPLTALAGFCSFLD